MKALLIALLLALPLSLSAAPKDEEENPPLKQSDLPLPVVIDESQGDVPVTLDGETVTVTGSVNATIQEPLTVQGSVNAIIQEPLVVQGSVNATIQEPLEVMNADTAKYLPLTEFCTDGRKNRQDLDGSEIDSYRFNMDCPYITSILVQTGGELGNGFELHAFLKDFAFPDDTSKYITLARFMHSPDTAEAQSQMFTFPYPFRVPDNYLAPVVEVKYYFNSWVEPSTFRSAVFVQGLNSLP